MSKFITLPVFDKGQNIHAMSYVNIDQIRYRIFRIGGTQATYQRTKKTIAHLIGKRDSEGDRYHIAQSHFPMKILEQYI